jgi:hypothetical protein
MTIVKNRVAHGIFMFSGLDFTAFSGLTCGHSQDGHFSMKHFRDFGDYEPLYDAFRREATSVCNRIDFTATTIPLGIYFSTIAVPSDAPFFMPVFLTSLGASLCTLGSLAWKLRHPEQAEAAVLRGYQRFQKLNPAQTQMREHAHRTGVTMAAPVMAARGMAVRALALLAAPAP